MHRKWEVGDKEKDEKWKMYEYMFGLNLNQGQQYAEDPQYARVEDLMCY
jgi:hypothetical protein